MPRCKNCLQKFEQYEFNNKYCKEIDCQTAKALYKLGKLKAQHYRQKKALNKTKQEDKTKNQKNYLKDEIQKLARLIDIRFKFNCCCCNKPIEGTGHGAHYHNKGGNENIQFNLHNIHRSRAHCNMFSSEHKKGYYIELERRYGKEYVNYLENDIRLIYKEMHFTSEEIKQALKTTRKIIRYFDKYELSNPILARDLFNSMIGLYQKKYHK